MSMIQEVEKKIAEYLKQEYPDVTIERLTENGELFLHTHGDCASCPFQCLSQEKGIEDNLKRRFDQVKVVTVNPYISEDLLDAARAMLRKK